MWVRVFHTPACMSACHFGRLIVLPCQTALRPVHVAAALSAVKHATGQHLRVAWFCVSTGVQQGRECVCLHSMIMACTCMSPVQHLHAGAACCSAASTPACIHRCDAIRFIERRAIYCALHAPHCKVTKAHTHCQHLPLHRPASLAPSHTLGCRHLAPAAMHVALDGCAVAQAWQQYSGWLCCDACFTVF